MVFIFLLWGPKTLKSFEEQLRVSYLKINLGVRNYIFQYWFSSYCSYLKPVAMNNLSAPQNRVPYRLQLYHAFVAFYIMKEYPTYSANISINVCVKLRIQADPIAKHSYSSFRKNNIKRKMFPCRSTTPFSIMNETVCLKGFLCRPITDAIWKNAFF